MLPRVTSLPEMKFALRMTMAVLASLLVHALVLNATRLLPELPDAGMSFQTPVDVELGFVDPAPTPPPALPPATPPPEPQQETPQADEAAPSPDSPRHAHAADASIPTVDAAIADAAIPAASQDVLDGGVADGGVESEPIAAPLVSGKQGAQVSLRVNLQTLRDSPYVDLLGPLIAQSPDVRAILEGSGINPLEDLDRIWVASPDLTRERSVIAGQYHGGTAIAVTAAKRLANSQGTKVRFRARGPFQVAPWPNPDPTPRVLALLGRDTFVVARERDLAAILAIAVRMTSPSDRSATGADSLGHGLLNLGPGVLAQLDVEGVANFIRVRAGDPPVRLTAQAMMGDNDFAVTVKAIAMFESAEHATAARTRLLDLQKRYATHPLVMLLGFSRVIRNAELKAHEATLSLYAKLSQGEIRNLLSMLAPPPPRAPTPPPSTAPRVAPQP